MTPASAIPEMVGANQNLNGSHDLTMPVSWIICHTRSRTYNDQPAYQILHPLQRHKQAIQNVENGVVWSTSFGHYVHWKWHHSIDYIRVPINVLL